MSHEEFAPFVCLVGCFCGDYILLQTGANFLIFFQFLQTFLTYAQLVHELGVVLRKLKTTSLDKFRTFRYTAIIPFYPNKGGNFYGKTHRVITGVALTCPERRSCELWSGVTRVQFKELSGETIREYIQKVNTLDKAGAYAIQEHGELIIDCIDGEMENVIGLPLIRLKELLRQFQVPEVE